MYSNPQILVVGAGVVGASIAFHLARSGASVTVMDKGEVCSGMTARSGALVRMHYTFAPEVELAWKSLNYFQNWHSIVGGSCGFVCTGFCTNNRPREYGAPAQKCEHDEGAGGRGRNM
jgi:sarcosine oxidase subunit beta